MIKYTLTSPINLRCQQIRNGLYRACRSINPLAAKTSGATYTPGLVPAASMSSTKQPLDPEWVELAKKQLRGKDPEETLTWHTAEVRYRGEL